ncbi:hypothetical protein ADUPG1_006939 [Aduncisulcus paluster]|uniref:Uncharacterized protein n=1 Tax=Aduncisulcus paluster TaxID=2918883 RepID=A0ABQ5KK50_9EUKA|nr:hypothetical protein ADUPG1_006939 [Aduncisulcus paluster]
MSSTQGGLTIYPTKVEFGNVKYQKHYACRLWVTMRKGALFSKKFTVTVPSGSLLKLRVESSGNIFKVSVCLHVLFRGQYYDEITMKSDCQTFKIPVSAYEDMEVSPHSSMNEFLSVLSSMNAEIKALKSEIHDLHEEKKLCDSMKQRYIENSEKIRRYESMLKDSSSSSKPQDILSKSSPIHLPSRDPEKSILEDTKMSAESYLGEISKKRKGSTVGSLGTMIFDTEKHIWKKKIE